MRKHSFIIICALLVATTPLLGFPRSFEPWILFGLALAIILTELYNLVIYESDDFSSNSSNSETEESNEDSVITLRGEIVNDSDNEITKYD